MNFKVFLQGSYGNDTNIYAESDVDIAIRLDNCFGSRRQAGEVFRQRVLDKRVARATALDEIVQRLAIVACLQK